MSSSEPISGWGREGEGKVGKEEGGSGGMNDEGEKGQGERRGTSLCRLHHGKHSYYTSIPCRYELIQLSLYVQFVNSNHACPLSERLDSLEIRTWFGSHTCGKGSNPEGFPAPPSPPFPLAPGVGFPFPPFFGILQRTMCSGEPHPYSTALRIRR